MYYLILYHVKFECYGMSIYSGNSKPQLMLGGVKNPISLMSVDSQFSSSSRELGLHWLILRGNLPPVAIQELAIFYIILQWNAYNLICGLYPILTN